MCVRGRGRAWTSAVLNSTSYGLKRLVCMLFVVTRICTGPLLQSCLHRTVPC